MTDYHWALQQAVYTQLTGASVAGGRVYDDVPQNYDFRSGPYVQMGETQAIPDDTTPGDGGIVETLSLHVWSRQGGHREAQQIISAIYDALHGQSLTVTGRTSALAWVRSARLLRDPDGITRHGIVDVEIVHRS